MDLTTLRLEPHPDAPDILCNWEGVRVFIGASVPEIEGRKAIAQRIALALRATEGISDEELTTYWIGAGGPQTEARS